MDASQAAAPSATTEGGLNPKRSARLIGRDLGLTASEMNWLLKAEGFLDGAPGAWSVTDRGQSFAEERLHEVSHRTSYDAITWDPAILDALEPTAEKRDLAREADRIARQQRAAARMAEAVELWGAQSDEEPTGYAISTRALVAGAVVVGVSILGIRIIAPRIKRRWDARPKRDDTDRRDQEKRP